jgi:type I restriction enzyme S subunit
MSEWKTYKLGNLINVKHGFAFKGEFFSDQPTQDILLTPGNFKIGGGFKADKFKYYNGDYPADYILKEGDILITMTDLSKAGDTLGYSAKIPKHSGIKYLHNQRLGLVQLKSDEIDPDFLYWVLRTKPYQFYIVGSATGSTVKHTSPTRICTYEFQAPKDIEEQKQIAQILTSLDDKIELNLQMNQTLEAMAQAIFKEWFVNFNFPAFDGELVDGLPKGWRKGNLGEMISFKNGKTSPERNNDFQYPVYGSNGIIGYSENFNAVENISIVGRVGSFCGSTYLSTKKCWVTDNAIIAQSINDYSIFTYLTLLNLNLNNFRAGSGQPLLNQTILSAIPLNIPSPELLEEFENQTMPFFKKIELNLDTNKQLEDIRNTALPKLMSGNIEVMNT